MKHCCSEMELHINNNELAIVFIPKFREYGVSYQDGGSSFQLIRYCPWCGCRLPDSIRDLWFKKIEVMGLEPDDPQMPPSFLSDEWYVKNNE